MQTTLDLPEVLLRKLEAKAAQQGESVMVVAVQAIERGLELPRRVQLPLIKGGPKVPSMTNAEIDAILDEHEHQELFARREPLARDGV